MKINFRRTALQKRLDFYSGYQIYSHSPSSWSFLWICFLKSNLTTHSSLLLHIALLPKVYSIKTTAIFLLHFQSTRNSQLLLLLLLLFVWESPLDTYWKYPSRDSTSWTAWNSSTFQNYIFWEEWILQKCKRISHIWCQNYWGQRFGVLLKVERNYFSGTVENICFSRQAFKSFDVISMFTSKKYLRLFFLQRSLVIQSISSFQGS